jgi:hypothetical protein
MKECVFTVEQRDDRRWHVCEGGVARSLASFGLKEDATQYARDLGAEEERRGSELLTTNTGRRERAGA